MKVNDNRFIKFKSKIRVFTYKANILKTPSYKQTQILLVLQKEINQMKIAATAVTLIINNFIIIMD